ncbi:prenyltransferase [Kitasatospora sp. NPDC004745]|uniref:prenyltransferase n=1 Tax=Kitasatospora sp. NPDC004745 TaxID=3364019 RepID=UPI0036A5E504
MTAAVPEVLLLEGVLDAEQAAGTVRSILAEQRPDGAIPWFAGHHLDPWDHTEAAMALDTAGEHAAAEAAYRWLAASQNPDGSWYAAYTDGVVTDHAKETNFCAYVAVGVWHHHLSTGDDAFLEWIWPVVRRALDFIVGLRLPGGPIAWRLDEDGTATDEALLTGSSSILHALRCGLAIAEYLEEPQPDWELATGRLGHAVAHHPERFLDKDRYSMDWYYPVLGTGLRGDAAVERIDREWDRFVVPGLGVRCVSDRPWVTGGESAELALALWAIGQSDRAVDILRWIQEHLRHEDGSYWTGYVFEDDAIWPEERTTWTAGALLLAVAALGGDPATVAVFGGEQLPAGLVVRDCC